MFRRDKLKLRWPAPPRGVYRVRARSAHAAGARRDRGRSRTCRGGPPAAETTSEDVRRIRSISRINAANRCAAPAVRAPRGPGALGLGSGTRARRRAVAPRPTSGRWRARTALCFLRRASGGLALPYTSPGRASCGNCAHTRGMLHHRLRSGYTLVTRRTRVSRLAGLPRAVLMQSRTHANKDAC